MGARGFFAKYRLYLPAKRVLAVASTPGCVDWLCFPYWYLVNHHVGPDNRGNNHPSAHCHRMRQCVDHAT